MHPTTHRNFGNRNSMNSSKKRKNN